MIEAIKKLLHKEKKTALLAASAQDFERKTNELIREVKEDIQKKFTDQMEESRAPLGMTDVENILFSLIEEAVSSRSTLSSRFAQGLGSGEMYREYYERMEEINRRTVDCNVKMEKRNNAKKEYETRREEYERLRLSLEPVKKKDKTKKAEAKNPENGGAEN